MCTRAITASSVTRQKILAHEGLHFEPESHTARFRDAHALIVGRATESLVRGPDEFPAAFTTMADSLFAIMKAASARTDTLNRVDFG